MATQTDPAIAEALAAIMQTQRMQNETLKELVTSTHLFGPMTQMKMAKALGASDARLEMALRRLGYD